MTLSLSMARVILLSSQPCHPVASPFTAHLTEAQLFQASARLHGVRRMVPLHFPITKASLKKEIALMGVSITVIAQALLSSSIRAAGMSCGPPWGQGACNSHPRSHQLSLAPLATFKERTHQMPFLPPPLTLHAVLGMSLFHYHIFLSQEVF